MDFSGEVSVRSKTLGAFERDPVFPISDFLIEGAEAGAHRPGCCHGAVDLFNAPARVQNRPVIGRERPFPLSGLHCVGLCLLEAVPQCGELIEEPLTFCRGIGGEAVEGPGGPSLHFEPRGLIHPLPDGKQVRDPFNEKAFLLSLSARRSERLCGPLQLPHRLSQEAIGFEGLRASRLGTANPLPQNPNLLPSAAVRAPKALGLRLQRLGHGASRHQVARTHSADEPVLDLGPSVGFE